MTHEFTPLTIAKHIDRADLLREQSRTVQTWASLLAQLLLAVPVLYNAALREYKTARFQRARLCAVTSVTQF